MENLENSDFIVFFVELEKQGFSKRIIDNQAENMGFGSYTFYQGKINDESNFLENMHFLTIERALQKMKNEKLEDLEFFTSDGFLICASESWAGFIRFEIYFIYQDINIYPCKILYIK